ncbi:hypothetical protein Nepgr_021492 [Nepenthes gracilis]|uniref:V-type proton ATPase subunit C n=1 Tax=Nepenthes gracilis TaxID=150966 RepID=A0AAD3XXE8_NEPGR|nr:hypothetical protein Nepgr_021492 [Nepenthes gracilis]
MGRHGFIRAAGDARALPGMFASVLRFVWDQVKYPTMSPLWEIVDSILGFVTKVEDDLKVMVLSYWYMWFSSIFHLSFQCRSCPVFCIRSSSILSPNLLSSL